MGYIYKITNINNNKIYIGKTTRSVEERFYEHLSSTEKNLLHMDMQKHPEYFTIEQICECDDGDLDLLETHYIITEKSYKPHGYNLTKGARKYQDQADAFNEIARGTKYVELYGEDATEIILSKQLQINELRTTINNMQNYIDKLEVHEQYAEITNNYRVVIYDDSITDIQNTIWYGQMAGLFLKSCREAGDGAIMPYPIEYVEQVLKKYGVIKGNKVFYGIKRDVEAEIATITKAQQELALLMDEIDILKGSNP